MIAILWMFFISILFGQDGFLSFLYIFLTSYVGHFVLHDDLFSWIPYSILHRYHHSVHSPFSYVVNILSECSQLNLGLFFLPLNPWSMLFGTLLFVSIHYINYSWLHVNEYHEKHHDRIDTNMAPDVLDTLFGTKHPDTPEWEDTTHMIPNVVVSALIVFWLKSHYKPSWDRIFLYFSTGLLICLILAATIIKDKV